MQYFIVITYSDINHYLIYRFQGTFQNNLRKGKGTMYWPNGDNMSGEWSGAAVANAVFTKGTCKNCPPTILYQMKHEINNELRSQFNVGYMTKSHRFLDDNSNHPTRSLKWKQYKIIHEEAAREEQELLAEEFSWQLKTVEDFKKCVYILLDGSQRVNDSQHFFKTLIQFFLSSFHGMFRRCLVLSNLLSVIFYAFLQEPIILTLVKLRCATIY